MKIYKIDALGCVSCIIMEERIKKLKDKFSFELEHYDYDYDKDIIEKYNIGKKMPVLIIFNNNIEIARTIGEKSEKELEDIIGDIK